MICSIDLKGKSEYSWLLEAVLGCTEECLRDRLEQEPCVISLVGGGGKTTCVKAMASECAQKGIKSVVATTTHMQMPHDRFLLDSEDINLFAEKIEREGQVWLGRRLDPQRKDPSILKNKSRSLSIEFVRRICAMGEHPVFIEADGARCLPCKVPADHEPVIVPETTHVLSVYGVDVLGRTFEDSVFRPELACALLGRELTDTVREEDLAELACSRSGGMKNVTAAMNYQVVLNKADTPEQIERGLRIAGMLMERGVSRVHITSELWRLM